MMWCAHDKFPTPNNVVEVEVHSPNSVSTLRGSYGRCKARCLLAAFYLWLSAQNGYCEMSKCISTVQARTNWLWSPVLGPSIFTVNFRIKWLLGNVQVHFDCEDSRKVWVLVLPSVLLLNIIIRNIHHLPPPQHHHPQHHHLPPSPPSQRHHSQHHNLPPPWHHHPQHHQPPPYHPPLLHHLPHSSPSSSTSSSSTSSSATLSSSSKHSENTDHHHHYHHHHHHHRRQQHYHILSPHFPTLFGVSCPDIFLRYLVWLLGFTHCSFLKSRSGGRRLSYCFEPVKRQYNDQGDNWHAWMQLYIHIMQTHTGFSKKPGQRSWLNLCRDTKASPENFSANAMTWKM